jgi:hypothetical protein
LFPRTSYSFVLCTLARRNYEQTGQLAGLAI